MIFYLNNQNSTGYRYHSKEVLLDELSDAIDELTKNGATYIDVSFESDAKEKCIICGEPIKDDGGVLICSTCKSTHTCLHS